MTDLPPRTGDDADDAWLLERARAGDSEAFGEIYRREVDAARRLARILVGEDGADELVAESFARVLTQLQAGRGPTDDFRAYLHVTLRNGFRDGLRATKESPSSDQPWLLDDVLPPVEELVADLDRDVAVTALATLPPAWQQVLWHLEVEGRKPAEVATLLDMDAGAVSSLAYRAREGLKRAYLDQHLQPATGGQCGWTQSRMSQYVRGDLSPRVQAKVSAHLDDCPTCGAAFVAVDRVNQKLAAWLFPVVLWGIAGADKGGLLWFAGAAGAGGAGATGTPIDGPTTAPTRSGAHPALLGAAATVVAAAVVGGVVLAVDDEDRGSRADDAGASAPLDPAPPPSDRSTERAPAPDDRERLDPVFAPVPTGAGTAAPTGDPTPTPATDPEPTDPAGPTDPDAADSDAADPEPTDPTTEPRSTVVVPERPTAAPIDACSSYGSLDLADTTGVTYVLTRGDGEQGPWTVVARADAGYVIADGAARRFSGDLGAYYPCVRLTDLDTTRHGPPLATPWSFAATVAVDGSTAATVEVVFDFSAPVLLVGRSGSGWSCDGVLDPLVPLGRPVTCTFAYTGAQPPVVEIDALALVPRPNAPPPGRVVVRSDGVVVDERTF